MKVYRIFAAIMAWIGLVMMFLAMISDKSGMHLVRQIVNYFSYFTILSNILVALSFTVSVVFTESAAGRFLARPTVRTGIAVYITVTGLVYLLILSGIRHPNEMSRIATVVLHYIVPPVYVLDWLIFVPKGTLRVGYAFAWPLFAVAFAAYTLVRGTLSGYYPYPFINAAKLGYARVGLNSLYILAAMIALGLLFVAVDRRLGGRQSKGEIAASPR